MNTAQLIAKNGAFVIGNIGSYFESGSFWFQVWFFCLFGRMLHLLRLVCIGDRSKLFNWLVLWINCWKCSCSRHVKQAKHLVLFSGLFLTLEVRCLMLVLIHCLSRWVISKRVGITCCFELLLRLVLLILLIIRTSIDI